MSTQKDSTVNITAYLANLIDNRRRDDDKRGPRLAADLEDFYMLLDSGLRQARAALAPNEVKLILDIQSSASMDVPLVMMAENLKIRVSDAIDLDGLADKWGVDGPALLRKIESIGDMARAALIDWTRQVWGNEPVDIDEAVKIFRGE